VVAKEIVAGVDEAGRGPLAGPVVAAAVILGDGPVARQVRDSKQLTAARREALAEAIRAQATAWALGRAEVHEIDRLNILQATLLAMQRAVASLVLAPARVLVDGNRCPALAVPSEAIVGGDRQVPCISAASILAKVSRDAEMMALDRRYPGYGFDRHKGYPTRAHREALTRLGPCAAHRHSFAPVRAAARLVAPAGARIDGS